MFSMIVMMVADVVRGSGAFGTFIGRLYFALAFWFAASYVHVTQFEITNEIFYCLALAGFGAYLSYGLIGYGLRYTMARHMPTYKQIERKNEPLLWWLPVGRIGNLYLRVKDIDNLFIDHYGRCMIEFKRQGVIVTAPLEKVWWLDAIGMFVTGYVRGAFMFWPLAMINPAYIFGAHFMAIGMVATQELGYRLHERFSQLPETRTAEALRGIFTGALIGYLTNFL